MFSAFSVCRCFLSAWYPEFRSCGDTPAAGWRRLQVQRSHRM